MLATKTEGWADRYARKAKAEQLERLLARRFGSPLPGWVRPRLMKAKAARLDDWAEQIFDAPSLEALLGQP